MNDLIRLPPNGGNENILGIKMELFFLFWLSMVAAVLIVAGLVQKGRNSGFLAVGGVVLIVTALLLIGSGIETTQNGSFTITDTATGFDINSFSVIHDANDFGTDAWIIMFLYFTMGIVIIVYALMFSAKKGTDPHDDDG